MQAQLLGQHTRGGPAHALSLQLQLRPCIRARNPQLTHAPATPPPPTTASTDREANVLDFVQFNRRAALNGGLKHARCSYLPPGDAVPGDEAIHM